MSSEVFWGLFGLFVACVICYWAGFNHGMDRGYLKAMDDIEEHEA